MLIDVSLLKENEDGSAVYSFDLSEDVKDVFVRFGIMHAIKAGIEAAKELHPDFDNEWTPEEDTAYRPSKLEQGAEQVRLSDQQLRDMCVLHGWDDSYQSMKAYRTVETMSLHINSLEY